MKRLALAAVGLSLVMGLGITPTWAQGPTPVPGGGLDKTLAYDVRIGNHEWGLLGAFNQFDCQWATVYVAVALDEPAELGGFDLYACESDDGQTYNPNCASLGSPFVPGPLGTWTTFIRTPQNPSVSPYFLTGNPPSEYVVLQVFSNHAMRYVAEVHCRPTYPSEIPTPMPTPTAEPTPTPEPVDVTVGGIAEPPDLATRTGASGMGGGTYAVLGAMGGVLAITVAGTVAAKRGGVQQ